MAECANGKTANYVQQLLNAKYGLNLDDKFRRRVNGWMQAQARLHALAAVQEETDENTSPTPQDHTKSSGASATATGQSTTQDAARPDHLHKRKRGDKEGEEPKPAHQVHEQWTKSLEAQERWEQEHAAREGQQQAEMVSTTHLVPHRRLTPDRTSHTRRPTMDRSTMSRQSSGWH